MLFPPAKITWATDPLATPDVPERLPKLDAPMDWEPKAGKLIVAVI
jgi:hypothetical protein